MDIKELARGKLAPRLAICYSSSITEISCSQPHRLEAVSAWRAANDAPSTRQQVCDEAARYYTNRTFRSPSEPLSPRILQAEDQLSYRCAVESRSALSTTLWKIGGKQLPDG